MPEPRQYSLLQFPGINVAGFQHVATVIRLDNNRGATPQAFADERSDVAKVHQGRNLYALMRRGETEIVDCVVWNRERMKVDLADAKVAARLNLFDAILEGFGAFARLFVVHIRALAYVSLTSLRGNVDGAGDRSQQDAQAAGVVAMFMRDEDCVEFLHVFADEREPPRDLFSAESGIDENTSFARNDQNRIAR